MSDVTWPRSLRPIMPTPFAPPTTSASSRNVEGGAYNDDDDADDDDLSSLDEEEAEKVGIMIEGSLAEADTSYRPTKAKQARRRTFCFLFLSILLACLLTAFALSHLFRGRHTFHGGGLKPISFEHLMNGTFSIHTEKLDWLAEAGDGVYSHRSNDGSLILEDINSGTSRVLVKSDAIKDGSGQPLYWSEFAVSADLKYILFAANQVSQWRHSSHANFYVHTVQSGETVALRPPSAAPHTAIASFSPKDHHIAYVHANDLYVLESPPSVGDVRPPIRVTVSGSPTTFNGVPDWVYEEEIFGSDSASWWSPDGSKLAFLSFDEERVPEYSFPIYNPAAWGPGGGIPYPTETVMRYPKPGYANPLVTIHVFDLASYLAVPQRPTPVEPEANPPVVDPRVLEVTYELVLSKPFDPNDMLVSEVTWVGKDDLMIKVTDRTAQIQRTAHFRLDEAVTDRRIVGKVVREEDFGKIDGGWIEPTQTIVGIDSTILLHSHQNDASADAIRPRPSFPSGYLDVVADSEGFRHVAYFSPPDTATPIFLTRGKWEVVESLSAIDLSRGLVYFIAANPSIERHLYSIPLPKTTAELNALSQAGAELVAPTPLTDVTKMGHHTVSFSPFAGFYVVNYRGPDMPWQKLYKVDDQTPNSHSGFTKILTDNAALAKIDAAFQHVDISYSTLELEGGYSVNIQELRPPLIDASGRMKYPLLVEVYGGPNSQKVSTAFERDWHHFLVTSMGYIVVRIDPRGTGFKGRHFRVGIRNQLGSLEASDVVEATRQLVSSRSYIDSKRLGIWGWSYGGYLTAKVAETNSSLFTLAMSVAPVTDWRYYDSVYTERYMSTPKLNGPGYDKAAVVQMQGFRNLDYLLAHGSGDDNVHFLNSAALLDKLTFASVRTFRFRMFTDSDHSIGMRKAYPELLQWMTAFLIEKWGEGGRSKQKWRTHTKEHFIE
ncbi:BZ3500_MvSof-1268-A1-R1_Chr6-3g08994 [Microbotryum saponariae]|uniref:BZ3500_MvSof-1268-A1-R1_Chr6-3g08994 protein n=1 Tax=Microbotryum saponariae TaxID=289078 RepID=A0A2X0NN25_9BASI|nr:BZ3500_MvSof-1268-A1-R1_Chr6-3g08994 [Microbotryum saponariae]SDA07596.1 BZ3501_MvSof-1269-A2-R1_Chr6-2g08698 [Microbotryum saponariae]